METEYISKEAALACFSDWIDRYGHEHSADEMTEYQKIEELPEADVVEVVRCRDCKHYHNPNSSEQLFCYWVEPNEDDFCSCGERREQNDPNSSNPSEVP